MKPTFVYLHIAEKPEEFVPYSKRFVQTYLQFPPGIDHDLIVVSCAGVLNQQTKDIFAPLRCTFDEYLEGGWDIGAHQYMAHRTSSDFIVCCTSRTYFWKTDWLRRIVEAREQYGEGLYGSAGSYEISPHIRTCFYGCNPKIFREFPHKIDTRTKGVYFERGKWNFTRWFEEKGGKAWMVTWDGVYAKPEWRCPPNIFRRGDQTNLIAWDKHSKIYELATPGQRKELENQADGMYCGLPGKIKRFGDRYVFHKFRD
jgi:hypothetical protein